MEVMRPLMTTSFNAVQPSKRLAGSVVTEEGRMTFVTALFANSEEASVVTPSGISTSVALPKKTSAEDLF